MAEREKLPLRLPSITREVVWQRIQGEHRFSVTIGFDPATGSVCDVFASGTRGSDMESTIADFCVTLRHALQSGADLRAISSSMLKVSDPSSGGNLSLHASPLGAIAAVVVAELSDG